MKLASDSMRIKPTNGTLFVAILATIILNSGCDDGTYNKRFNERLTEATRVSNMTTQLGISKNATDPTGATAGQLRFPKIFDQYKTEYNAQSNPDLAQLPGISIPGFSYSFERLAESGHGDFWGFNAYVHVVPVGEESDDDFRSSIGDKLKTKINSDMGWRSHNITDLEGKPASWQKLQILAGLPFQTQVADEKALKTLEGRMELYHINTGKFHVVLIYRCPSELVEKTQFDKQIEASVGSFKAS